MFSCRLQMTRRFCSASTRKSIGRIERPRVSSSSERILPFSRQTIDVFHARPWKRSLPSFRPTFRNIRSISLKGKEGKDKIGKGAIFLQETNKRDAMERRRCMVRRKGKVEAAGV